VQFWVGQSPLRGRRIRARRAKYLASLGYFWPSAAAFAASLLVLGACAVGPDFAPPPAPPVSGYTPDTPTTTASAEVAGGAAQHFAIGRDIPAEWWKVFHSKEIDALIAEALRENPSLQAAQAALWQAKETLYASGGKLLPAVDANASVSPQQFSPAEFGQTVKAVRRRSLRSIKRP
jgi:outer membrane protein TolC